MASNTFLRISNAKRGAQSDSKIAKPPKSSDRAASAASLQELMTEARRCPHPHTKIRCHVSDIFSRSASGYSCLWIQIHEFYPTSL
jgi:hypothetical protein